MASRAAQGRPGHSTAGEARPVCGLTDQTKLVHLISSAWDGLTTCASHSSPAFREQEELDRWREEPCSADLAIAQF